MGMFDSFILEVKCPYCGAVNETELQTKLFDCLLNEWRLGDEFEVNDLVITNGIIRNTYGGCKVKNNPECGLEWEKKFHSWTSGFGRRLFADIVIEHGRVAGAINVRGYFEKDEWE